MKIKTLKSGQKPDGYLSHGYPMMASVAHYPKFKEKPHKSKKPSFVLIGWQDKKNYYGNFATGFGFFGLRFPKKTTRELTKTEINKYKKLAIKHSNGLIVPLRDILKK